MNQGPDPRELAERFLNGESFDRERLIELPGELAKSPTFALGLRVYSVMQVLPSRSAPSQVSPAALTVLSPQ